MAKRWLTHPKTVASIAPSGPALADKMASLIPAGPGWVLEVGPGTGAITAGLFRAGMRDQVWALEKDPVLAAVFRHAYPSVRLIEGDATHLATIALEKGLLPIKAVVSSLGLLSMPASVVESFAENLSQLLPPGAPWIQYSYGRKSPVPSSVLERGGWVAKAHGTVLANLPPARVWTFVRSPLP